MKFAKRWKGFGLIVFLLSGCTLLNGHDNIESFDPFFRAAVQPLEKTVLPRYRPVALKFRQLFIYQAVEKGLTDGEDRWSDAAPIEIVSEGSCEIISSEQEFQWDIKVQKLRIQGDIASHPRLPMSRYRMWSNQFGQGNKIKISLPAYDQTGVREVISKKRYAELVEDTRRIAYQLIVPFEGQPIQSGDILFRIDKAHIRTILEEQFESPESTAVMSCFSPPP